MYGVRITGYGVKRKKEKKKKREQVPFRGLAIVDQQQSTGVLQVLRVSWLAHTTGSNHFSLLPIVRSTGLLNQRLRRLIVTRIVIISLSFQ